MRKFQTLLLGLAITVLGVASLQAGSFFTITSGTDHVDVHVDPYFLNPGDDVVDFYSYGSPDASSANTGFEQPETALVFLTLDDTGNYGLVVIMDIANDDTGGRPLRQPICAHPMIIVRNAINVINPYRKT
jgi:hypothetical protein